MMPGAGFWLATHLGLNSRELLHPLPPELI
jgi:hypothetical protein